MVSSRQSRGFTLIELLIVVVILGILAAVVLPQFTNFTDDAKTTSLAHDLQALRGQIQLYRIQHKGVFPAQGLTAEAAFLNALTQSSNPDGTLSPTGSCGPYLNGLFPPNPVNSLRTVRVTITDAAPDNTTGWSFNSVTGDFRANSTEILPDGRQASVL